MGSERGNSRGVNLIDALGASLPIADQTRILKYAQVLGDGWPAHGKAPCELNHSQRPLGQALQNGDARRVAKRMESGT